MIRKPMQKRVWQAVRAGVAGIALVLGYLAWPSSANAFDKLWFIVSASDATVCELWDDVPGAGANNESGLFWVQTESAGNEYCTAQSNVGGKTSLSTSLSVRAAVNDGGRLTVQLRSGSEFCSGGHVVSAITIADAEANSAFVEKTVALPADVGISDVCITLDDNPNTVASERASALIDYVQIWGPGCFFRPSDVFTMKQALTGFGSLSPRAPFQLATPLLFGSNGICWRETFSEPN